jgi:hypothetical protein
MKNTFDLNAAITRRHFFRRAGMGLGVAALGSLLSENVMGGEQAALAAEQAAKALAPRAKRIIYLSMIGAPSQLDLFDYKPSLTPRFNEDLGEFLRKSGQRLRRRLVLGCPMVSARSIKISRRSSCYTRSTLLPTQTSKRFLHAFGAQAFYLVSTQA